MLREIYNNFLLVLIEKPERLSATIPNSDARLAAERIWKMIEWLHDEFLEDTKTQTRLEEEAFQIRNISRTLSYANHVYLLDGILKRMYTNMFIAFNTYGISGISEDITALADRKTEMKTIVEFRHTVAAHTAYANPDTNKDDDLTATNSIHSFLAVGYDGDNMTTFKVNAGEIISNGKASKRKIPSINLHSLHTEMEAHFQAWETMFVQKLQEAHKQLPIKSAEFSVQQPS